MAKNRQSENQDFKKWTYLTLDLAAITNCLNG